MESSFFTSSSSWQLSVFLGLWPHPPMLTILFTPPSPLCVCYLSLIRILVMAFRPYPGTPGSSLYLTILNLITYAKILSSNEVTFINSRVRT